MALTNKVTSSSSLMQLSKLGRRGENESCIYLEMVAKEIKTRAHSIERLAFYL